MTTHICDISFHVESENGFDNLTKEEIIQGIRERLDSLEQDFDHGAIGHVESYD
jgi:hypothetical protein